MKLAQLFSDFEEELIRQGEEAEIEDSRHKATTKEQIIWSVTN